jgi:hypothetical protein
MAAGGTAAALGAVGSPFAFEVLTGACASGWLAGVPVTFSVDISSSFNGFVLLSGEQYATPWGKFRKWFALFVLDALQ